MKLYKIYKSILTEYKNIINRDEIETAINNKELIMIGWNNGIISGQKDIITLYQLSGGLSTIAGRFDFNKKEVLFFFGDDWSDFKFVKKVQQFLQDLIRLNWINDKWKLTISNQKSTTLNLGGNTVSDLLKYDSTFTKIIPICYHGTSDYYLDNINSKGITPNMYTDTAPNWNMGYTVDSSKKIYLSIDYDRAEYYASIAVDRLAKDGIKSKKLIVQIKNLPIGNVTADDDILTNMGQLQLLNFLSTNKKTIPNYISGIRQSAQFAYNGRISNNYITKIIKK